MMAFVVHRYEMPCPESCNALVFKPSLKPASVSFFRNEINLSTCLLDVVLQE
jgi:hypothetical protein